MFYLQRASAGSGKTYALAKKYIWYLIAVRVNGRWRLRTSREIADGLPRILAITFTNKATAEMKQRIVDKLAALAKADGKERVDPARLRKTDYLKDFYEELSGEKIPEGFPFESAPLACRIGEAARTALSGLLNEYSDFKVSTIDSFFQTVLRTFAYEANLNDTYQVEIDSDYVANAAIDMTLDSLNDARERSAAAYWIGEIVRGRASEGRQGWNVFQKSNTATSVYSSLRQAMRNLESEDFKEIREELDSFFNSEESARGFIDSYRKLRDAMERPLLKAAEEAAAASRELEKGFAAHGLDLKTHGHRFLAGHIEKLRKLDPKSTTAPFSPYDITGGKPLFNKKSGASDPGGLTGIAVKMYGAYDRFLKIKESPEWKHWRAYAPLLPYLGLIGETRRRMQEFLDSNNTIQLGETNSMLRRIIGDDDAPFVYERMGGTINHYLIDEFQDTSRLQWENIYPLLSESDSRGEDNLVIGDAKQSIYRFRNADPTLITHDVPERFPDGIFSGTAREENTNWRSSRRIVEFNNFFFSRLIGDSASLSKGVVDFGNIYSNVVQFPRREDETGYIDVTFLPPSPKEGKGNDDDTADSEALSRVAPLVGRLLDRGYAPKEIAVLVESNQQGKDVIESFVAYNSSLPAGERPIEFISEESLLISSAESVGIIINVLDHIHRLSMDSEVFSAVAGDRVRWETVRANFSFYALWNSGKTPAEQVMGFMEEGSPDDAISAMLAEMQSTALPALVEAIVERFVPGRLRRDEAVFIAGLQDLVLEFVERYPADTGLFLQWWRLKGAGRSISSPEGTDAVQVMTIHKSKGLEFGCVIVPFATGTLVPKMRSEWRWVSPAGCLSGYGLPSYIPVETKSSLAGTEHEHLWNSYSDLYMLDMLNKYYVAFTRAKHELYVFSQESARMPKESLTKFMKGILFSADDARISDDGTNVVFGQPLDPAQEGEASGSTPEGELVVEEYRVNSSPGFLHYVEGDDEAGTSLSSFDDDGEDPRSEGSLLHWVMENIETADDIPLAFARLKMRGLADDTTIDRWREMISEKIGAPGVREWFAPGWRVLNERPVFVSRSKSVRPDRVMVSPGGDWAVIVDYKFGEVRGDGSYERQVEQYVGDFSEASGIKDVRGYIWYVAHDKIVEVRDSRTLLFSSPSGEG